jgi:hypothetical protein
MRANELAKLLAPFSRIINKTAPSPVYRSLFLSNDVIRGCAAFGTLEIDAELDIGKKPVYIDGDTFIQVIRSLPPADLKMSIKDGALFWECERAKGKLALLGEGIEIPAIETDYGDNLLEIGEDFGKALEVGSLSAGGANMMSVGMYGITFSNEDDFCVYASDDATASSAQLDDHVEGMPDEATLSPEACSVLQSIVGDGSLAFDDKTIYYQESGKRLLLRQIAPLKKDIKGLMSNFDTAELSAPLDQGIVSTFIRRAEALAESGAFVSISVEDGQAKLSFESGKSSSDEFYLIEGGDDINVKPITLQARRMSRALAHSSHMVFDYAANRNALMLIGEHDFKFVISGRETE